MEKQIEQIILFKNYSDLGTKELMLIQDWAKNEEEFLQIKTILTSANVQIGDLEPSRKLKSSLDSIFQETYPNRGKVVSFKPYLAVLSAAAAIVVAVLLFWKEPEAQLIQVAKSTDRQSQEQLIRKQSREIEQDSPALTTPIPLAFQPTEIPISEGESAPMVLETASMPSETTAEMTHSDFLIADALEAREMEMIEQNPLIFSVLHTSY